jgi:methylmalonyl-CoA mutase C-terminal domain/subunit
VGTNGQRVVSTTDRHIRVLVAKPGLDGHDRGAQVVARALSDAGFEVIYTGIRQTPEMIVAAAVQEDVDCVGLSILSGSHMEYAEAILDGLKQARADHVHLLIGGIVPSEDIPTLRNMGVAGVFGPGSQTSAIAATIEQAVHSDTNTETSS